MKRLWFTAAAAVLALSAASAWAGGLCCGSGRCHCIEPPDQHENCCESRFHWRMPSLCCEEHARKLIEQLEGGGECCERIHAAKALGNRLHADACACPDVLNALVKALTCDTCWEVRRAAAWSIAMQDERTPMAVAALYIASKADRHFLVRDRATDGLAILIRCRTSCYKDLFRAADVLIGRIRADYDPTNGTCINLVLGFVEQADGNVIVAPKAEPIGASKMPEPIGPPKADEKKDEEKKDGVKKDEEKKDEEKKEEKKDEEKKDDKKEEDKKE